MPASTRSLETIVLQAHRAKGVRYPTATQKECFKTWYSYALRKGEEVREAAPGGRTYL
ncbi:major facilitator superfamily domain-containing [Pyrenophora seminiperda CCB06]|uniref:Major facilitator superfamily domain-containing n=1 Tax=Pyrenophora seminiperda CCB06 TaxID=1302712 RepID=A0A3M7M2F2_9PLEO|nr:major facilitator superfamily domain-containing [Pyrenophora seminiperda CCB06]